MNEHVFILIHSYIILFIAKQHLDSERFVRVYEIYLIYQPTRLFPALHALTPICCHFIEPDL